MRQTLERLIEGENLNASEAEHLLLKLAEEDTEPEITAAVLIALRAKGEDPGEVRGFANAMRRMAVRPELDATGAVDVVGTGGDGSGSYNISTGAAILTAACGVPVVKHGNRSVSSMSGSADVLSELGLPVPLSPHDAARCLRETGFTFLFAPHFHPAMATIAPIRKRLGIRTVFNILGPLTNPSSPGYYVIGAFSEGTAALVAGALSGMELRRAFVIHGAEGWDEATPVGPFTLHDVEAGRISTSRRSPQTYGVAECTSSALRGGDAATNATALRDVFSGKRNAFRDAVLMNCSLALEVTGAVSTPREGVETASRAVEDGRATAMMEALGGFAAGGGEDSK